MRKKSVYRFEYFTLYINYNPKITEIIMNLLIPIVNTKNLPYCVEFLKETFPSVLKTQCFNEGNLKFEKEVEKTEIGHLLEHILIEHICLALIAKGKDYAECQGRTDWNWNEEREGTFHIFIDTANINLPLFNECIKKSISLLEGLLATSVIYTYVPENTLPDQSEKRVLTL